MSTAIVKKLVSVLILSSISAESFANTQFSFTPRSKIEAQIGSGELNRIEVNGGDIMEVIGDAGKYSLYWSSDWRNLFIKPKVAVGETLDLSLIFFGGLAQDIRFTAGDTTAKTITINVGGDHYRHFPHSDLRPVSNYRLQSEVTSMMRAMFEYQPRAEGIKGKYYVTDIKRVIKVMPELQITQIKAYRYKNLSGAILEVKNTSKTAVALREEDFKGLFKATLAINLKSTSIAARSKTLVFVVTHGGSDDK